MASIKSTISAAALFLLAAGIAGCQTQMTDQGVAGRAGQAVVLTANLTGASEVPPVQSDGRGVADIAYDDATNALSWSVEYEGLSGPMTAAHFHGPAAPGSNASVQVPISGEGAASPLTGSAVLSDEQAAQLMAGQWYVNIHTAANPGGEIRGQVVPPG